MMRASWVALALTTILSSFLQAATIVVPVDAPTVQAAILSASPGDTVLVLPGVYKEHLSIDQDIVVKSADGPATTTIDGGGSGSVVMMTAGTIEGFSITGGGGGAFLGGGVQTQAFVEPGPAILGNWIFGNALDAAYNIGAGVFTLGPARVIDNRIYANTITIGEGAGLTTSLGLGSGAALVEGNEIFDNHVTSPPPPEEIYFGAVTSDGESTYRHNIIACNSGWTAAAIFTVGTLENNTIVSNVSQADDAVVLLDPGVDGVAAATRNVIAYNTGIGLVCATGPGTFEVECNDLFDNSAGNTGGACAGAVGQDGNIGVDPEFAFAGCPHAATNWCLSETSPLLPAASPPGCELIGALDACAPTGIADASVPVLDRSTVRVQPNPFTHRAEIAFRLREPTRVTVTIVDVHGRRIRAFEARFFGVGEQTVAWDGLTDAGARAAAGGYVARVTTDDGELTRKLVLVR